MTRTKVNRTVRPADGALRLPGAREPGDLPRGNRASAWPRVRTVLSIGGASDFRRRGGVRPALRSARHHRHSARPELESKPARSPATIPSPHGHWAWSGRVIRLIVSSVPSAVPLEVLECDDHGARGLAACPLTSADGCRTHPFGRPARTERYRQRCESRCQWRYLRSSSQERRLAFSTRSVKEVASNVKTFLTSTETSFLRIGIATDGI